MKPASRLAWAALLWLCCGAQALAGADRADLASGSYTCANGAHRGNINELNMSSANGQANYIEVKVLAPVPDPVLATMLPSSTKLCYTTKNTGNSLNSICETLGSTNIKVYRAGTKIGTGADTTFAVGDYLVLEVPSGTNEVNEAILLNSGNLAIDYIQLCTGSCSTGYWSTSVSASGTSCGAQRANVDNSVKDVARFPDDGTGTWLSNTLDSRIPARGTLGATNAAVAGPHHFELRHDSGSELSCATSTLTIKACGNTACTIEYTDGASGTISATGGSVNWDGSTGGAGGAGFVIAANTSSVTKNFQALGTATLGLAGLAPGPSNATTCNFGGTTPCQFTALSAGFILADSRTGTTDVTIPTQTAGVSSAPYYLRALQTSNNNPAVCTPSIINQADVPVTIGYACNNPNTCQGNLLKVNGTTAAAGGGDIFFTFDSDGSASFGLLYDDAGQITVAASKSFALFSGATPVVFSTAKQFVVKPHHFDLSGITCGATDNHGATTAGGPLFCKAGANFSVVATARSATAGVITENFGQEYPNESVKLTSTLVADLGLIANPSVTGSFTSLDKGVLSGTFAWNEVGIITLTPSVDKYLGASDGDVSGTAVNVGRFVPDHYDVTLKAPAPPFAYSGQPIAVEVTAKLAAPTPAVPLTATSVNYMAAGFPRKVTLSALAADGSALAPALGALASPDVLAASFNASVGAGAPVYTFTTNPTRPTTIRLRGTDPDGVTSALTEANIEIRSGRLRLSNAFGRANANLTIPMRAEFWTGQSWLLNNLDTFSLIPAGAVALTPSDVLKGVTVVAPIPPVALVNGQGSIVLKRPDSGTGSVDVAVNLGSLASDRSCLALPRPDTTGAALPWLRSQNGQNANCPANSFDRDPSARGNFGIFAPETRRVIHVRELFN